MKRRCSNFLPLAAPPAGASRQPGRESVGVRAASFGAFARHLSAVLAGSRYNFRYRTMYRNNIGCADLRYIYIYIFPPFRLVQTPHLKPKSARVKNTSTQLISRQNISSHPWRSFDSSPPCPKRLPRPQRPLRPHHPHHRLDLAPRV